MANLPRKVSPLSAMSQCVDDKISHSRSGSFAQDRFELESLQTKNDRQQNFFIAPQLFRSLGQSFDSSGGNILPLDPPPEGFPREWSQQLTRLAESRMQSEITRAQIIRQREAVAAQEYINAQLFLKLSECFNSIEPEAVMSPQEQMNAQLSLQLSKLLRSTEPLSYS